MKCFPSSDDAPVLVRLKPVRVKPELASARVNIRNGHFATFDKILCYPVGTNAQVPVQVTRESVTHFTISNGIFDTFDDALECCNLLAQQQNRSRLTRGYHNGRSRRVRCSGCGRQHMSFWCKENEPVRLLNHEVLERYLNHPCIELERIKVDQFFEHLRRDEFGENLRRVLGDEFEELWRAFESATIDGHTGAITSPETFASNSSSVTSTDVVMDKGEHAR